MTIQSLDHKRVCILGYRLEGKSTYQALKKYAPHADITIADSNPAVVAPDGCPAITSPDYLEKLQDFDVIIKSPGIAWYPKDHHNITSATELFLDSIGPDVTVIGITGTKGKSTTTNLIYQILVAADKRAFIAGNIGDPMLDYLPEATAGTTFVIELSSYQLEDLKTSPHIAVLTSFFPDHLDRHGSMDAYFKAKQNIVRYQTKDDLVFYNAAYPECERMAAVSPGRKIAFDTKDFPDAASTTTQGVASNLAAAYLVALECGVEPKLAIETLKTAKGLAHRQESLGVHHGIEWINDSAATTPESTIAAMDIFGDAVDTIIVGGLNRDYDFGPLGERLAASSIHNLILFPDTGANIREAIEAAHPAKPKIYFGTQSMTEAVAWARQHTAKGKACLLSSGSPSYNLFKNYPERGQIFREAITAITDHK